MRKFRVLMLSLCVGLLTPDIFIEPGLGCIERTDGEEICIEEVHRILSDFYEGNTDNKIEYKIKILEYIRRML